MVLTLTNWKGKLFLFLSSFPFFLFLYFSGYIKYIPDSVNLVYDYLHSLLLRGIEWNADTFETLYNNWAFSEKPHLIQGPRRLCTPSLNISTEKCLRTLCSSSNPKTHFLKRPKRHLHTQTTAKKYSKHCR